jgi:enoyl-CoA hydratase/carnithine racemase
MTARPEDSLQLTREGRIAVLRIRRPEKKNAFTTAMWQRLGALCAELAQPGEPARLLRVEGGDDAFCAGADIAEMATLLADPAALEENNRIVAAAQLALERLPLPTLAVIDGPCFGGGFGIAAACDFRLASTRSRFAVTPSTLGLLYSVEDTRRLVRLLGDSHARRLLLRGERLDAATALAWGAVDATAEPHALPALAAQWSEGLAAASRTSMAGIKATLALVGGDPAADEAAVRAAFSAAFHGPDFAEGAAAFLARRPPAFP